MLAMEEEIRRIKFQANQELELKARENQKVAQELQGEMKKHKNIKT